MSSFIGGLIGLTLLAALLGPAFGLALILPGLVPHFFTGGAAGVYGNATGGRRGAIAGAFVNGLLVTFLPAFLLKVLGPFGSANTTFGDADFGWLRHPHRLWLPGRCCAGSGHPHPDRRHHSAVCHCGAEEGRRGGMGSSSGSGRCR